LTWLIRRAAGYVEQLDLHLFSFPLCDEEDSVAEMSELLARAVQASGPQLVALQLSGAWLPRWDVSAAVGAMLRLRSLTLNLSHTSLLVRSSSAALTALRNLKLYSGGNREGPPIELSVALPSTLTSLALSLAHGGDTQLALLNQVGTHAASG
jgi:hypothetical protein